MVDISNDQRAGGPRVMASKRRRGPRPEDQFVCALVAVLSVLLLWAPSVSASGRSQALYAKGLIAFRAEQWDEAYRVFESAVQADPSDAVAVYYRGLTAGRLGIWNVAVEDVERAAEMQPDLPGAALDVGILSFEAQQYPKAEHWLQRAYTQPRDRFRAALFLGLVRYRLGDDRAAQPFLAEAEKDPALRVAARYYRALALLRQGQSDEGRAVLAQVKDEAPETGMGQVAAQYLAAPAAALGGRTAAGSPWTLHGDVGFEYDSNVVLAPNDGDVESSRGIGREGDGRIRFAAGGSYRVADTDWARATLSYDAYQSVHVNLTEFDLDGQRLRLALASQPGRIQYGIAATYDFYARDYQSFYQQVQGLPWLTVFEGPGAATQFYYRVGGRDFFRGPFEPYRDSMNNAVGARQFLRLGDAGRVLSVGYQFDDEAPRPSSGDDFQCQGHQLDAEVTFPVRKWGTATAGYRVRLDDYESPNSRSLSSDSDAGYRRHDAEQQFVLRFEHQFTPHVVLDVTGFGVLHHSNLEPFDYDRTIASAGLQYRF